jgi:hypothetical protein
MFVPLSDRVYKQVTKYLYIMIIYLFIYKINTDTL